MESTKICSLILAFSLTIIPFASYANDLENDLDNECKDFCVNNGFEDGEYLPPDGKATCKEDYKKNPKNEICCCEEVQT